MKKFLSIFGGLVCAVICVLLFGTQIGFITFKSVKSLITKESVTVAVQQIDFKDAISSNVKISSNLYGAFDTLGFSVEETDKIFQSDSFRSFLSEYLYNNIDNIVNEKDIEVNYDELVKLVSDIENETKITFKNKEKFLKILEEKFPEISKPINFSNTVKKDLSKEDLVVIRTLLGNTITVVFIAIFIIIYFVMCLLRWSLYKPLIWYGITTTISSFIMMQVFLSINTVKDLMPEEFKSYEFIISPALSIIKSKGLTLSLVMLAVGVIMVIAFALIHKKIKEKEENEEFKMLDNSEPETNQTL